MDTRLTSTAINCRDEGVREQQTFLPPSGLPRVPGHEIVGEIVQVPESETHWKVGQRVASGIHGGHCGKCNNCLAGDFMTCENEVLNGEPSPVGLTFQ